MAFSGKILGLLAAGVLVGVTTSSQAGITISDKFNLSDNASDPRFTNKTLNNTTTMEGDARWLANTNYLFSGSGSNGYVVTNASNVAAMVAIAPTSSDPIITVEADLKHLSSGMGNNGTQGAWLAVGLSSSTQYQFSSGVFVLLHSQGQVQLVVNNGGTLSSLISISVADLSVAHHLKLTYDTSTNKVTAWIDSTRIGAASYTLSFTPDINYAGFSNYNALPGGTIDNFSVTTVPEPAALGLLSLGGMFLAKRGK